MLLLFSVREAECLVKSCSCVFCVGVFQFMSVLLSLLV